MSGGPLVVVRADGDAAIGLGHVMRCLALTQALGEAGGAGVFVLAGAPAAVHARIREGGATSVALDAAPGSAADAGETAALAARHGAAWIVLDGYHFDGSYQRALVERGLRVLALDDHGHAGTYHADLVLNQNLGADPARYTRRASRTRLLLGPAHVLLRPEFRAWRAPPRVVPERAERIIVSLGGSDPDDVTARVLAALDAVPGPLAVEAVLGAANPHRDTVAARAAASPHQVSVVVDVRDMPARMARADLAVAAAGGSAWELARVGTPQVTVVLADNQRPAAAALAAAGLAEVLGWHADLDAAAIAGRVAALADDADRRAELVSRGTALIDGRGPERVLAAMGLIGAGRAAA